MKYIWLAIWWGVFVTVFRAITNDGYTLDVFMYGGGVTCGALAMLWVIKSDEKADA